MSLLVRWIRFDRSTRSDRFIQASHFTRTIPSNFIVRRKWPEMEVRNCNVIQIGRELTAIFSSFEQHRRELRHRSLLSPSYGGALCRAQTSRCWTSDVCAIWCFSMRCCGHSVRTRRNNIAELIPYLVTATQALLSSGLSALCGTCSRRLMARNQSTHSVDFPSLIR